MSSDCKAKLYPSAKFFFIIIKKSWAHKNLTKKPCNSYFTISSENKNQGNVVLQRNCCAYT